MIRYRDWGNGRRRERRSGGRKERSLIVEWVDTIERKRLMEEFEEIDECTIIDWNERCGEEDIGLIITIPFKFENADGKRREEDMVCKEICRERGECVTHSHNALRENVRVIEKIRNGYIIDC